MTRFRPGGALYIFWVRGRAIGKGIYFQDIGIKNGINFHNFGIRNGTDLQDFAMKYKVGYTGCLKKYPLLTGNKNKTIRYHYSLSGQLNLSIFNLDPHTLLLKIGHRTLGIQACKVQIYSAAETRGFVKGPSHDLLSQVCCTGISTLTFTFLH